MGQYSAEIVTKAPAYEPGEDKEAYYERVFQAVTQPVDAEKLKSPITSFLKPYLVPENERKQRREESAQLRRKLIEMQCYKKVIRPPVAMNDRMGRAHAGVCYYFAQKGQPEMIERYEQIFCKDVSLATRAKELEGQGVAKEEAQKQAAREQKERSYERGHFLAELMEPLKQQYTLERLVNMTLEEAEEHMVDINFMYLIGMNAETYMSVGPDSGDSEIAFTPEDYSNIKFLKQSYSAAGIPMARLYAKGNPYYELVDTEKVQQMMSVDDAINFVPVQTDKTDFGDLGNELMSIVVSKRVTTLDMLHAELDKRGINIKQPYTAFKPDGSEVRLGGDATNHLEYLKNGGSIIVQQGDKFASIGLETTNGKIRVVDRLDTEMERPVRREPRAQANTEPRESVREEPRAQAHAEPRESVHEEPYAQENAEPHENADKEMYKMRFNTKYAQNLTDIDAAMGNADPWYIRSSSQFRTMKKRFEELKKMGDHLPDDAEARAQCKTKLDDLQKAAGAYLGHKGENGKNDLEKSRIALAKQIQRMALEKWKLLDTMEKLPENRNQAQAETETTTIERFDQKYSAFISLKTLPNTKHMFGLNKALQYATSELNRALDTDYLDQPIDRTMNSVEEKTLAYMTVKALILNDQAGRTEDKPGRVSEVFNSVPRLGTFVDTVRKTPSYQNMLENMTKKGLYDFVVKGEYKQLAQQINKDFAVMGSRQQREQEVPQAQNEAPQREQQGRRI